MVLGSLIFFNNITPYVDKCIAIPFAVVITIGIVISITHDIISHILSKPVGHDPLRGLRAEFVKVTSIIRYTEKTTTILDTDQLLSTNEIIIRYKNLIRLANQAQELN